MFKDDKLKEEERIAKVLADIQASVPESLLKNAVIEVPAYGNLKEVCEKALVDPDFPEEKKEGLRILLASGDLDKKRISENPKYTKMIDNWVSRKINQAIKKGILPPKSKLKDLESLKKIYEKVHPKKN